MHIKTTTDPISLREVNNPADHPCLYEGDGTNGLEISFESMEHLREYQAIEVGGKKVICGNDADTNIDNG